MSDNTPRAPDQGQGDSGELLQLVEQYRALRAPAGFTIPLPDVTPERAWAFDWSSAAVVTLTLLGALSLYIWTLGQPQQQGMPLPVFSAVQSPSLSALAAMKVAKPDTPPPGMASIFRALTPAPPAPVKPQLESRDNIAPTRFEDSSIEIFRENYHEFI